MFGRIISTIVAHKAGIMLGGAMVGVVATAILAAKDARKHAENQMDVVWDSFDGPEDEDKEEFFNGDITTQERYKKVTTKKERAIIFAKSYWRTGLSMAVTFGLMILSHRSMVKELAATAAALGVMSTKYKELAETLKEKYPDTYEKVTKFIDEKNIRKEISEKPFIKEETYDGRTRYYEPETKQIFFAKPEEFSEAAANIDREMMNNGSATLFDFLSYFPAHCEVKTYEEWTKNFGWFQGSNEMTLYEDTSSYMNNYIETKTKEVNVIVDGEKIKVHKIYFSHTPDIEPDTPYIIEHNVEHGLKLCKKKSKIKEVA